MWALDFQVDVTVDGRQVRFLNIIDEYTREALATRAARSFNADATIAVLDDLVTSLTRRPQHVRMDNGPELTAHALADWCQFIGVDPAYIDPGSPAGPVKRRRIGSAVGYELRVTRADAWYDSHEAAMQLADW